MKNTKITVTVTYEMKYDGEVTEADIELWPRRRLNDIIEDADAITNIKVKTNEEALAILDTETVADDDHLDTATTSVSMRWYDVYEEWNKQWN